MLDIMYEAPSDKNVAKVHITKKVIEKAESAKLQHIEREAKEEKRIAKNAG